MGIWLVFVACSILWLISIGDLDWILAMDVQVGGFHTRLGVEVPRQPVQTVRQPLVAAAA